MFSEGSPQAWALVYHLVAATAGAMTAALAREMWKKHIEDRFRITLYAFGAITLLQLLLALLTAWTAVPPPVLHSLECTCTLLAGWGLAAPFFARPVQRAWLMAALLADLALGVLSFSAWQASNHSEPGWTLIAWGLLSLAGVSAGALALGFFAQERPLFLAGALGALALGALLWTLGLESVGRAVWLAAFITLPVGITRGMLRDLESTESELQTFSQHALRQSQQMIALLRSSTTLVSVSSVSTLLSEAVEGVALGADASLALIALIGDDAERTVGVMALYPSHGAGRSIAFPLNSHPIIAQAVRSGQQTILQPSERYAYHPLYELLGGMEAGPAIVQPMASQDRTIGVIIVGNTRDKKPLGEGTSRLLEALGAQIATAVENIRLYHRLDAQAKELARLLAVREEEASQRAAILESIADGVLVTNRDDRIILVNATAADILNMTRAQLVGRAFEAVLGSVIPLSLNAFRILGDSFSSENVRALFEINQRSVQASLAPVRAQSGELTGAVAVLRDVTRERQAELAKSEFITAISHELRTPLTSIKGYVHLLNTGLAGELNDAQQGFVGKLAHQTDHLIHLINSIIQYSEMERGASSTTDFQPVSLQAIASALLEAVRERAESSGLSLALNADPDAPPAYADPGRTSQIVEQLLDNALRFTPAPGHITLSIKAVFEGEDASLPSHVSLAVSDTGVGIAPQDIERIFERFVRADSPMQVMAGGLGLGLTVARALAEAQGGKLWATSPAVEQAAGGATEEYPGATFTLRLPAYVPDRPA